MGYYSRVEGQIVVDREIFPQEDAVRVEVLHQARDPNGLPLGGPSVLFEKELALRGASRNRGFARLVFPARIRPVIAPTCYYRVTPFLQNQ